VDAVLGSAMVIADLDKRGFLDNPK